MADDIGLALDLVGFFLIAGFGIRVFFSILTSRFPSVTIETEDRGYKKEKTFRLYGFTILKNNIIKLLLNDYRTLLCGDIRTLTAYKKDAKFLGLLPMGTREVYAAVERHGYLFALIQNTVVERPTGKTIMRETGKFIQQPTGRTIKVKGKETDEMISVPEMVEVPEMMQVPETIITPILDDKPIFYIEGKPDKEGKPSKGYVCSFSDTVLVPIKHIEANHYLKEEEISKAKEICGRFLMNAQSNNMYNESINPFVNVILAYLPIFLIIIALGFITWLNWSGMSDLLSKMMAMYAATATPSTIEKAASAVANATK